ncbi:MAG TPA: PAS domain S-box protein [Candidatus Saccharimonadales bacterium]|nr:PAS domain S-box protein [Candidatus Saccharimonadales bacterium]
MEDRHRSARPVPSSQESWSHDQFRALLESAPDAMVIANAHGKITLVNAQTESLFGYTREELLGQSVEILIPERYHGRHEHYRQDYGKTPRLRPMGAGRELFGRRKDGTEFPVEISLSPFRTQDGILVFSAIRDISLQKAAQTELREAKEKLETRVRERTAELVKTNEALQGEIVQRELAMQQRDTEQERARRLEEQLLLTQKMEAIGRLAGGIAHDFNNLLGVILGNAEMLLKSGSGSRPVMERVEQIKMAGEEAAAVTRQLLAFARQQVSEPQVLDINLVLTDLEPLLRRIVEENIRLEMSLSRDLGDVKIDRSQLAQVILNLVANARDAMGRGGRLTIESSNAYLGEAYARDHIDVEPGAYVQLSVTDSGQGMDKETVSRIFEPFFTTKEKGEGSGLGLATVYGIVRQSGGHIWVYSEPGRGTTFKIYLPRVSGTGGEDALAYSDEASNGTETILLVEDSKLLAKVTRDYLMSAGYRVLMAAEASEALKVAEEFTGRIHLLLTDVVMPHMNGRELSELLLRQRPELKVLYMSGHTAGVISKTALLEDDVAFIEKPFTHDALGRKIRHLLDAGSLS